MNQLEPSSLSKRNASESRAARRDSSGSATPTEVVIVPRIVRPHEDSSSISTDSGDEAQRYFADQKLYTRPRWIKPWYAAFWMTSFSIGYSHVTIMAQNIAENGGFAYLIPYFAGEIFLSVPFAYLETIMGQYFQETLVGVWGICPILKGTSFGMCSLLFIFCAFSPVEATYALYMIYGIFNATINNNGTLPWESCRQEWNSCSCDGLRHDECPPLAENQTLYLPTMEYFLAVVLRNWVTKKDVTLNGNWSEAYTLGNEDHGVGTVVGTSAIILAVIFLILLIIELSDINISGMIFTFTCSYAWITFLLALCYGLSLKGGKEGVIKYMSPQFGKLMNIQVWLIGSAQAFLFSGSGMGLFTSAASFNPPHHDVFKDVAMTLLLETGTTVACCMSYYAFLGSKHGWNNTELPDVFPVNTPLLYPYVEFPDSITHVPGYLYVELFVYFALVCLTADTLITSMQAAIYAFYGEYRRKYPRLMVHKSIFSYIASGICLMLAMTFVTRGGYWFYLIFVKFIFGLSCSVYAASQIIGYSWIWGMENICHAYEAIYGHGSRPSLFFRICWKYVLPFACLMFLVGYLALFEYTPLEAFGQKALKHSVLVGGIVAVLPLIVTVVIMISEIINQRRKRRGASCLTILMLLISPEYEHQSILEDVKNAKRLHWKHYAFLRFPDEIDDTPIMQKLKRFFLALGKNNKVAQSSEASQNQDEPILEVSNQITPEHQAIAATQNQIQATSNTDTQSIAQLQPTDSKAVDTPVHKEKGPRIKNVKSKVAKGKK